MVARPKVVYTGKLNVRQYSDAELRSAVLTTDDPTAEGEMSADPPRHDENLEFVAQYTSPDTLICAFGHHHKRGFLLRGGDGLHHLIGKDCAAEHYGLEWDTFVRSVSRQVDRQKSLRWLHEISKRILDAGPELEAIVHSPEVRAFDAFRLALRNNMAGEIYDAFALPAHHPDTWMRATFRERDHAKERRQKEAAYEVWQSSLKDKNAKSSDRSRLKHNWEKACREIIYTNSYKSILRCPARAVFSGSKMAPRLDAIRKSLTSQAVTLQGPQQWKPDMVAKSLAEAAKQFDGVLAELLDVLNLFASQTLDHLEVLFSGTEYEGFDVQRVADGLIFRHWTGKKYELLRPANLKAIDFSLYDRLRL